MALPKRWFTYPDKVRNHHVISQFISDFRNKVFENFVVVASRRAFKSETSKRLSIEYIMEHSDETILFIAPTRAQAKSIYWTDLKDLIPRDLMKGDPRETDLIINLLNGSKIIVSGAESHERLQGMMIHGIVAGEYQKFDPRVYIETLSVALNDTNGWLIVEGRPLNKGEFYKKFKWGNDTAYPEWKSYTWTGDGILSDLQLNRAKASLTKADYSREYEASFETSVSAPYYAYSEKNNLGSSLRKKAPIIISCDFNATSKPMAWLVGQELITSEGMLGLYVHKELVHQYTNTHVQCEILEEYLKGAFGEDGYYDLDLIFYGDFAGGHTTSNSTESDWEIIETHFRNVHHMDIRTQFCKSIRDSITSTNLLFENALEQRRLFVNASECPNLVKDWVSIEWKDNGRELLENEDMRGHACRAIDYYCYLEHPAIGMTSTVVDNG